MPVRLLLILSLLVQPLTLAVVSARTTRAACLDTSCCQVVETVTCCGETVREMQCGKSGGECRCALESDDSSPAPTPRPQERLETAPLFTLSLVPVCIVEPAAVRLAWPSAPPAIRRTHNETCSLLGTWRT